MPVMVRSVLISDQVDAGCAELLRRHGIAVTQRTKMAKEELISELKNHDALIVRSETKVTADVLAGAGSGLRVVGRAGTGVDNIDVDVATRKGVIVLNTPGGNSISACELTCSLITTLARNVPQACQSLKEGRWDRKLYTGSELSGKTLAVLGLGRIGREVATRMQAFGMKAIGFDPIISAEAAKQFGVDKMELEDIWPQADYITVHTPLIPQTRNLINEAVLKKCKNSVKIINVARGGIVDEAALLSAIKEGQCGGAALDVFCEEPPKSTVTRELIALPQVIATPHLGASTEEAQKRVAVEIAEQIIALAENLSEEERQRYTLTGVVNAPVLAASMEVNNGPWISLGKELGKLTARMAQGAIPGTEVKVTASGPGTDRMTYLGTAVLLGMLTGRTKNGLNLVNAPTLAKESGMTVTFDRTNCVKREEGDSNNTTIIGVTLHQKDTGETYSITGTVRGDGRPHLLSVNGATFESGIPLGESNGSGNVRTQLRLFKGSLQTVLAANTLGSLTSVSVARCLKGGETWVAIRSEQQEQVV